MLASDRNQSSETLGHDSSPTKLNASMGRSIERKTESKLRSSSYDNQDSIGVRRSRADSYEKSMDSPTPHRGRSESKDRSLSRSRASSAESHRESRGRSHDATTPPHRSRAPSSDAPRESRSRTSSQHQALSPVTSLLQSPVARTSRKRYVPSTTSSKGGSVAQTNDDDAKRTAHKAR
jgi:hypothetical protein